MGQQVGPGRSEAVEDKLRSGWGVQHNNKEDMFTDNYNHYRKHENEESNVGSFHSNDHYDGPNHCSTSELYHLPEDFQPYTNGGYQLRETVSDDDHKQNQVWLTGKTKKYLSAVVTEMLYTSAPLVTAKHIVS